MLVVDGDCYFICGGGVDQVTHTQQPEWYDYWGDFAFRYKSSNTYNENQILLTKNKKKQ